MNIKHIFSGILLAGLMLTGMEASAAEQSNGWGWSWHWGWGWGDNKPATVPEGAWAVTSDQAGTNQFRLLSNELGTQGPHWWQNEARTTLAYTLTRDGKTTTVDISDALEKATAQLQQTGSATMAAGTTFQEGDIVRFLNGANGAAYDAEIIDASHKGFGMDSGFNQAYGVSSYMELDFAKSGFDGSLDMTLEKSPSGQPLPGVLATLLIGGGIAAYAHRRRRNRKVLAKV